MWVIFETDYIPVFILYACVYLQPKWGYLPSLEADVTGRVCRYCMHQFLKVKDGKWKSHSNYCPVDLFSGCVLTRFQLTIAE